MSDPKKLPTEAKVSLVIALTVALISVVLGAACEVSIYRECRAAGFSAWYCVVTR